MDDNYNLKNPPKKVKIDAISGSTINIENILPQSCLLHDNNSNLPPVKAVSSPDIEIEEVLVCNICQEVLYNCVSIQPCLHTYCAFCLLEWKKSGSDCPSCRGPILKVSKNYLVGNIVDKFFIQNPNKVRPISERQEADFEVEKNKEFLFGDKTQYLQSNANPIHQSNCRICNYPGYHTYSEYGNFNNCTINTVHVQCNCCNQYIPSTLVDNNTNLTITCEICHGYFCYLLYGNCGGCDFGCLFTLRNLIFNSNFNNVNQVPQFVPGNFYESSVLRNYLNRRNLSVSSMYMICLEKLALGEISIGNNVNDTSASCINCGKNAILDLVFAYASSIPKSSLPPEIASRPDCYYGKSCRTQRHRQAHCEKYNHVCPQTRF